MRSFRFPALCLLVACGGRQPPAPSPSAEFDPELIEACIADEGAAPRHCVRAEDGTWKTSSPPTNLLLQGRLALENGHYEAAVYTLTQAILKEDECGKQYAREERGVAYFRLGRHKESFMDFASIVRDGPENPFYGEVGAWLKQLEPHLPSGAMAACWASYDPDAAYPPPKKGKDDWPPDAPDDVVEP